MRLFRFSILCFSDLAYRLFCSWVVCFRSLRFSFFNDKRLDRKNVSDMAYFVSSGM